MISTSSHDAFKSDKYVTYAISGNCGRDVNYQGKCYPELAPKLAFWKIWHDNIGKISKEKNDRYYIDEYWKQVLSELDPEEVYRQLDYSILLCYESNTEFCHRHIVASWFEILLGVKSLRALYLFEKGEKLEAKADELEEKNGKCYDDYRQYACYLRCDADMAEEEYQTKRLIKIKTN